MRYLLIFLILAGCSDDPRPKVKRTLPKTGYHIEAIDGHQLIIVDLPDYQRCYIWRDREFSTASMQCPTGAEPDKPTDTGESGYQR